MQPVHTNIYVHVATKDFDHIDFCPTAAYGLTGHNTVAMASISIWRAQKIF